MQSSTDSMLSTSEKFSQMIHNIRERGSQLNSQLDVECFPILKYCGGRLLSARCTTASASSCAIGGLPIWLYWSTLVIAGRKRR